VTAETDTPPRWYRRLPESAKAVPPGSYGHCAASTEVVTPDAMLRLIHCGKRRQGHGRWHANRGGVRWRGKWKRPIYMREWIDSEVNNFSAAIATYEPCEGDA
jgi:hypothetical protein